MKPLPRFIACLAFILALAGCGSTIASRTHLAAGIAAGQLPVHDLMPAGNFSLASYARFTKDGEAVRVYIEGDGLAWLGSREPSRNPTPTNPVALRLAARDSAPNVVWLARPCQYEGFSATCPADYWTSMRFAPEVVFAYMEALDTLKQKHAVTGFELVGFSGGGAIATLLAARRGDILSLRTVAGNLDIAAFNGLHGVSPMPLSLNPRDVGAKIQHIPQLHFTGGNDDIVPQSIYDSFALASPNTPCLHHAVVKDAAHEKGWDEVWPKLLQYPLSCAS
ncbi:MAG: alpha/beta hydrolase [Alphaproteobacteria bacterium]|nr:MAG: alpha/beta hydrolase [Alphaproteobacteria bacterium]